MPAYFIYKSKSVTIKLHNLEFQPSAKNQKYADCFDDKLPKKPILSIGILRTAKNTLNHLSTICEYYIRLSYNDIRRTLRQPQQSHISSHFQLKHFCKSDSVQISKYFSLGFYTYSTFLQWKLCIKRIYFKPIATAYLAETK